jgi:hypothetical protein
VPPLYIESEESTLGQSLGLTKAGIARHDSPRHIAFYLPVTNWSLATDLNPIVLWHILDRQISNLAMVRSFCASK